LVFPCLFEDLLRHAREQLLWKQSWQMGNSPVLSHNFSV